MMFNDVVGLKGILGFLFVRAYLQSFCGHFWYQVPPLLKAGSLLRVNLPHQVSQEKLLQYIHFNRHHNTILIEHNTKLINQLRTEMEAVKAIQGQSTKTYYQISLSLSPGAQVILVRKEVGNPAEYFDKTFAEYQKGFSANGVLEKE